jgi:hypothetical protein
VGTANHGSTVYSEHTAGRKPLSALGLLDEGDVCVRSLRIC